MREAGRRWPNRVRVIDWVRQSAGHSDWFYSDGLHLTPKGARAMARLVRGALTAAPAPSDAGAALGSAAGRRRARALRGQRRIRSRRSVRMITLAATEAPVVFRWTPSPWRTRRSRPPTGIESR